MWADAFVFDFLSTVGALVSALDVPVVENPQEPCQHDEKEVADIDLGGP